jgi:hypothetical protein
VVKNIVSFANFSWRYFADYDSDSTLASNCDCDYMHRCSTITSFKLNSINTDAIANEIIKLIKSEDDILDYCIKRIVSHNREISDINNWDMDKGGGYYGEEIYNVYPNNTSDLGDKLNHLLSLESYEEKINYVLELEYGFVLESLKTCSYKIKKISIEDVFVPNQDYSRRLDMRTVERYKKLDLNEIVAVGIFEKRGTGGIRLIDGYHRFAATKLLGKKQIQIIIASKDKS